MEGIVKKYQQKFNRVKNEMDKWDELQSRLLSLFRNTSAIIQRLPVIEDSKNYGALNCVNGIKEALMRSQLESLQSLLLSMNNTLEEFRSVVASLDKVRRDGKQLVKGGSNQPSMKTLQHRVGVKPSLMDCIDGLVILHDMYHSEYLLKSSIISAIPALALKPNSSDVATLQKLLVDQPNIPKEEVQFIFDIIFAEEIS